MGTAMKDKVLDLMGEELQVGDRVVFTRYSNDSSLYTGVIRNIKDFTIEITCDSNPDRLRNIPKNCADAEILKISKCQANGCKCQS